MSSSDLLLPPTPQAGSSSCIPPPPPPPPTRVPDPAQVLLTPSTSRPDACNSISPPPPPINSPASSTIPPPPPPPTYSPPTSFTLPPPPPSSTYTPLTPFAIPPPPPPPTYRPPEGPPETVYRSLPPPPPSSTYTPPTPFAIPPPPPPPTYRPPQGPPETVYRSAPAAASPVQPRDAPRRSSKHSFRLKMLPVMLASLPVGPAHASTDPAPTSSPSALPQHSLDYFPDHLLENILSLLPPADLARCGRLNKTFHRLSRSHPSWAFVPFILGHPPSSQPPPTLAEYFAHCSSYLSSGGRLAKTLIVLPGSRELIPYAMQFLDSLQEPLAHLEHLVLSRVPTRDLPSLARHCPNVHTVTLVTSIQGMHPLLRLLPKVSTVRFGEFDPNDWQGAGDYLQSVARPVRLEQLDRPGHMDKIFWDSARENCPFDFATTPDAGLADLCTSPVLLHDTMFPHGERIWKDPAPGILCNMNKFSEFESSFSDIETHLRVCKCEHRAVVDHFGWTDGEISTLRSPALTHLVCRSSDLPEILLFVNPSVKGLFCHPKLFDNRNYPATSPMFKGTFEALPVALPDLQFLSIDVPDWSDPAFCPTTLTHLHLRSAPPISRNENLAHNLLNTLVINNPNLSHLSLTDMGWLPTDSSINTLLAVLSLPHLRVLELHASRTSTSESASEAVLRAIISVMQDLCLDERLSLVHLRSVYLVGMPQWVLSCVELVLGGDPGRLQLGDHHFWRTDERCDWLVE